jgi:hypothetical protein
MAWSTPIFDRQLSDVEYAMLNQNSTSDLKGAFNISDANRIINNTIYLRDLLNLYGYDVEQFPNQTLLTETDLPHVNSVIEVMKSNIIKVVDAFYKDGNPEITYGNILDYISVNAMELNLNITNTFLESMIASVILCGNYISGQSILL